MRHVPAALVALRVAIGPLLVWIAWDGKIGVAFMPLFLLAVLSDIFDGMLARRLGVASIPLRRADSVADVLLYLAVLLSAWLAERAAVLTLRTPLVVLLATLGLSWLAGLARFGRLPSYHTYASKAWGLTLCAGTIGLFGWSEPRALWPVMVVGFLACAEDLALTLILPTWQHDVPGLWVVRRAPRP